MEKNINSRQLLTIEKTNLEQVKKENSEIRSFLDALRHLYERVFLSSVRASVRSSARLRKCLHFLGHQEAS